MLLDRRRVDLTGSDWPTHPHHHEGSWAIGRYKNSPWAREISLPEAIELVESVRAAAATGAQRALELLSADVPLKIAGIAIRECPALPPTIEACIRDNRAQAITDSVMYRMALASAAEIRGWPVYWYDRKQVFVQAARQLAVEDIDPVLKAMGRSVGPPWQAKHKLAASAAIAGRALPGRRTVVVARFRTGS